MPSDRSRLRVLLLSNHVARPRLPELDSFIRARASGLRDNGATVEVVPLQPNTIAHRLRSRLRSENPGLGALQGDSVPFEFKVPIVGYLRARRGQPKSSVEVAAAALAATALCEKRWDVVVGHGLYDIPAGGVAQALSAMLGVPFVAVAHGGDINYASTRAAPFIRNILSSADATFFVSSALQKRGIQMGARPDRAFVTPNGVDPLRFVPQPTESGNTTPTVLFVGNLIDVKGADRLPKIVRELSESGRSFRMDVIGDGPLRNTIQAEVAKLPVRFLGSQPQDVVARHMSQAAVLVLPSRNEGWPSVVLEAQACGTPVVGADVGGISEAIGTGGVVLTEVSFDEHSWADAIWSQIDTADRKAIASRTKEYSWSALGAREMQILCSL